MIDLSIIVPTWNTRALTLECLASLEDRVGPGRSAGLLAEVIAVDNGSRDGTALALRQRFPWARVKALPTNRGFAAASNAGLAEMRGRHALLLNSDARVLPGALELCVDFLDAHPGVGALGPQLLHADGRPQSSVHAAPRVVSELLPRGLLEPLFRRRLGGVARGGDPPLEVEAVRGAALFVRGEVIREVGPLPEDYFFFLEETDWCRRIRGAGWRVVHLPAARVVHLSGASSKRVHPARTRIEYHRSLYRYFRQNRGPGSMAMVTSLRFAKSLFYVVSQAPLAAMGGRYRARWRVHRQVVGWHLRGCPASGGLAALAGSSLPGTTRAQG